MDRLDRRLIQLQIEREAVRREKDEASQKRFGLIEEEIAKLQKEIADYDEIWQAEKAQAQGSAQIREEIDKIKFQIAEFTQQGRLQQGRRAAVRQAAGAGKAPEGSAGDRGRTRASRARRSCCARRSAPRKSPKSWRAPPAFRSSKLMQGERDKLLMMEDKLHERVVGPGRGHRRGRQRDPPLALGPVGPEPPDRLLPVPRPDGRGQDRAVQGAGRLPVRQRRPPDPHRHERVHGEAFGRAPDRRAARLRGLRGGRLPDRGRAPQALQRAAARRGREGASGRLQRAAAGARRWPPDRWPGPHRELQEHGDRDDQQHRLADHPGDGRAGRPRRSRTRSGTS